MLYAAIASLMLAVQVPPTGGAPPTQQGNGQPVPGQQLPPGGQVPGGIQQPPISGQNVMVDGIYQVLAYEKFGQVLPGMNTLKVAIRNNILIFPGDGKLPGKMLQLTFGPNNTVTISPLGASGTGIPPVVNNNGQIPPVANNTAGNAQNAAAQNQNTIRQATGTPPVNNGSTMPNQNGVVDPNNGSETGVYVLSTEFFSISVGNQGQVPPIMNGNPPVATGQTQPATGFSGNVNPLKPPTSSGQTTIPSIPPISAGTTQAVLVLRKLPN